MVAILEQAFRDEWGRVLAGLIGFLGDFDLAEEATQEALSPTETAQPTEAATQTARNDTARTLSGRSGPLCQLSSDGS